MWSKILTVSIVFVAAGGFFYYQNHDAMERIETAAVESELARLNETKGKYNHEVDVLTKATAARDDYQATSNALEQEHGDVTGDNERTDTEIADKKPVLAELEQQLADIREKIGALEDVQALAEKVAQMRVDNDANEQILANETAKRQGLEETHITLTKQVEGLVQLRSDQRAGLSPKELKTTISNVSGNWTFVIINGGADKGIVLNSKLAILRGENKIAEVNVNNVEATRSSADVIPSSLVDGEVIQPGDTVVSVRPTK